MAKINWTAEAQQWLLDIFQYIALDSPSSAIQTVDGIYQHAQTLANFPELGHRYWPSDRNVRVLLYGHYRIAYLIRTDSDIDVLGVFHGALDIERYRL